MNFFRWASRIFQNLFPRPLRIGDQVRWSHWTGRIIAFNHGPRPDRGRRVAVIVYGARHVDSWPVRECKRAENGDAESPRAKRIEMMALVRRTRSTRARGIVLWQGRQEFGTGKRRRSVPVVQVKVQTGSGEEVRTWKRSEVELVG